MATHNSDLWDFISALFETTQEKITAVISGVAIISPAFNLKDTSETAALWLPILGCIWLGSQIVIKWWLHLRRSPGDN
jgi:hypothetical protein